MIRINLLGVERERTQKRAFVPSAHVIPIAATLIVLATVLIIGWWFWSLRQASNTLDTEIARAETETRQLRTVLAQVQTFEAQKAQLQQRVTLIERLRRGQSGPVHALDEISKAIPERLWLTEMSQKGEVFVVSGMTTSLTALSDLVGRLEASNWFKKPVDIIDSQADPAQKEGELFKFSVRATFSNPEAPAAVPATAAGVPAKKAN